MGFQNNTFPLAFYGLQDVFSGFIVFLKLWTSNSDPKLVGRSYLEHLYEFKGMIITTVCDLSVETWKFNLIGHLSKF